MPSSSKAASEPSSSNWPTLSIDLRSGSVVMQLGGQGYEGTLPLNPGDSTKLSQWWMVATLKPVSAQEPAPKE